MYGSRCLCPAAVKQQRRQSQRCSQTSPSPRYRSRVMRAAALALAVALAPAAARAGAALALSDGLHDEFTSAIGRLFAQRPSMRSSVPPELLAPFVDASRYSSLPGEQASEPEPIWGEWREGLRAELHAIAQEMVSPTERKQMTQMEGETAQGFAHRNRGANNARIRIKEIYKEPSVEPHAVYPKAKQIEDYAGLMGFLGSSDFRRNYFERRPLLLTRNPSQLRRVNGDASEAAADSGDAQYDPPLNFEFGMADVVSAGEFVYGMPNSFWHHRNVKVARGGFHRFSDMWTDNDRITAKEIGKAIKTGSTAFFNGVNNWSPKVAGLNLDLAVVTSHLTNVNLYVTAGGVSKSMSPHNDIQCTLIIQLEGRKRWRLWPKLSLLNALLSNDRSLGEDLVMGKGENTQVLPNQLGDPYIDVVLAPGDVLYVPRGVIHTTATAGERSDAKSRSAHLTAGIDSFHGISTAAVLGGKMGWLSHTKNHSFLHAHLPDHLPADIEDPQSPDVKLAAYEAAFDSLLDGDAFPPSAEAAAARCGSHEGDKVEEEGSHFLVSVLCELGRGMHAWQTIAAQFADTSSTPTAEEWAKAVSQDGGADPRKAAWQPEKPSAFEQIMQDGGGLFGAAAEEDGAEEEAEAFDGTLEKFAGMPSASIPMGWSTPQSTAQLDLQGRR